MDFAWLELYSGPRFWAFPVATAALSMFAFMLFALPLSLIAWKEPPALQRYRIQSRAPRAQTLVRDSLRYWGINNALMFALVMLLWPWLSLSGIHLGPWPDWYVVVGEVLLFVYLDDFLFYWLHRAMHHPWLFKRIHSVHHRIRTPWAITGHYFHPLDYLLTGGLVLVGPILLSVHVLTLWCWVIVRQWEAAEGHCGYDFPWSPTRYLPGSDGAIHHDWHHSKVRGNYAGFFSWTDRVFGTFSQGYAQARGRRGEATH